ncbi:MAG: EAL domain-containing protein [Thermoanaerobaculia bacterium]|nr:EAL domain-containing protein [Thermoanaerobaculia bacterium]
MFSPFQSFVTLQFFVVAVFLAGFALGLVWRHRGHRLNPPLVFLLFVVAIWLFASGMTVAASDEADALFWTRAAFASLPIVPFALWQVVVTYVGPTRTERNLYPFVWCGAIILVAWCQASSALVTSIERRAWGYYWSLGSGWIVLLLCFLVLIGIAIWRIVDVSRTQGAWARRVRMLAWAVAVGSLALVDLLPATGFGIPPLSAIPIGVGTAMIVPLLWTRRLLTIDRSFSTRRVMDTLQGAVLVVDLDGRVRLANRAAVELLGVSRDVLSRARINDLIESPKNVGPASDTLMRGDSFSDRPMLWKRRKGGAIQVSVSASMLRDDDGLPSGLIYLATPISDRSRADQVEYQAYHDSLTGLPNRNLYQNEVEQGIEPIVRKGRIPAVLFLDIDGFKLVNDSLGQEVGDQLIQIIARRLRGALRSDDLIARVGGDEFAIFIDLPSHDDLDHLVSKLRGPFDDSIVVGGEEVFVTMSMGAAIWPDHGDDASSLLRSANAALSEAKLEGKGRFVLFGESIRSKAVQRFNVASNLRKAVENEEFELHYQPILDLANESIIGAEALIRWRKPDELLLPAEFVGIAEEAGLIGKIGGWVIREACRQGREWEEHFGIRKLSINLSAIQIEDHDLVQVVAAELDRTGLSPKILELEITETAAMADFEQTVLLLGELKSLDVSIAIDDFGTGYSSLSYLQRFPIDLLNIDQSFVRELSPDRHDYPIISGTIAIARALGLEVTAEGVETAYQLAFLRVEHCDYAQGFGISHALPAAEFESFIRNPDYPHKGSDVDATRPVGSIIRPD